MAKKNATTIAPVSPTTTTVVADSGKVNKSQAIRDCFSANPKATTQEVIEALKAKGIEVNTVRVNRIADQLKPRIDTELLQVVAAFLKTSNLKPEVAIGQIESVGSFVETCKGKNNAVEAVRTFVALVSVLS
jgi:hypothetical protein